jgi:hypothetical protein
MSGKSNKHPGLCPIKGQNSVLCSWNGDQNQFSSLSLSNTRTMPHYQMLVIHPVFNLIFNILPRVLCYIRLELTSRRHWRKIPPLDMFFSASSSPKLSELAKMRTSAMFTSRCRNDTATSIGIPCVGSITSSSLWKQLHASTESCVVHNPSFRNNKPTTDTIHCATSQTVLGSIPGGVTGVFFCGSFWQNHVTWGRLSLWKWVPGISPRVKAAGVYGWRPTTLVVPNVEMIRGLNLPGTP